MGYLQAGQYESLAQAATAAMQSSEAYSPFQRIMASGRRRAGGEGGSDSFSEWTKMLNSRDPEQPFRELMGGAARAMKNPTQQSQQARLGFGDSLPNLGGAARNVSQAFMWGGPMQGATTMPRQSSVSSVISPGQTPIIRPSQQPQQMRRQAPSASTDGSLLTGQDAMGMGSFGVSTLLGG
jgi:hypothetical protein